MDSRAVNTELRALIRPLLKQAGFTKFTDRNAWCVHNNSKWIVNFQSFNNYLAGGVGCTTFSFSVNLGVYFDFHRPAPDHPAIEWPKEYEATFRFTALKRLAQPLFHSYGDGPAGDRSDVFFVMQDGSNLHEVVDDAGRVLQHDGLPTLSLYNDPLYAYCTLFDYRRHWPPRSPSPQIEVMPCGNLDSPRWRDVVLSLGHWLGRDPRADIRNGLDEEMIDSILGLSG